MVVSELLQVPPLVVSYSVMALPIPTLDVPVIGATVGAEFTVNGLVLVWEPHVLVTT